MNIFLIEEYRTGEILSVISAKDEESALDKFARTQGWPSFAEYRAMTMVMPGELRVAPFDAIA